MPLVCGWHLCQPYRMLGCRVHVCLPATPPEPCPLAGPSAPMCFDSVCVRGPLSSSHTTLCPTHSLLVAAPDSNTHGFDTLSPAFSLRPPLSFPPPFPSAGGVLSRTASRSARRARSPYYALIAHVHPSTPSLSRLPWHPWLAAPQLQLRRLGGACDAAPIGVLPLLPPLRRPCARAFLTVVASIVKRINSGVPAGCFSWKGTRDCSDGPAGEGEVAQKGRACKASGGGGVGLLSPAPRPAPAPLLTPL